MKQLVSVILLIYITCTLSTQSTTTEQYEWYVEPHHIYDTDVCNIQRVTSDITLDEFNEKYLYKQPLIISPTTEYSQYVNFTHQAWTLQYLLNQYGHSTVQLGTFSSLTVRGECEMTTSLMDYINELHNESSIIRDKYYLFDRSSFFQTAPDMLSQYHKHHLFSGETNELYDNQETTIAIGGTGTGINFHFHRDGYNELIYGRKRWFFYPPNQSIIGGYNSAQSVTAWYDSIYEQLPSKLKPMECVQHPGDIVYVPEGWYHATINLGDTVAVAGQASYDGTNTVEYYIQRGKSAQDTNSMLYYMHHALQLAPHHHQIFTYIGTHYYEKNDYINAINNYQHAVSMNALCPVAHISLAMAYMQVHQYELAYNTYIRAVELSPQYTIYILLAELAGQLNKPNDSIKHYEQAIQYTYTEWMEHGQPPSFQPNRQTDYVALCTLYNQRNMSDKCISIMTERTSQYTIMDLPTITELIIAYNMIDQPGTALLLNSVKQYMQYNVMEIIAVV